MSFWRGLRGMVEERRGRGRGVKGGEGKKDGGKDGEGKGGKEEGKGEKS